MEFIIEETHDDAVAQKAVIKVIGVGGGGSNMIDHMLREGTFDIDIYVANTDAQHLNHSLAKNKIQLGQKITKGLGAGSKPEVGAQSAGESYDDIKEALDGADLVFISAGMGGGTGTGAAPIIAQAAKEIGALTIGVVTIPFYYEGKKRKKHAVTGLEQLQEICDQVIVIENDKLQAILDKTISFKESYKIIDDILYKAVHGISGIILTDGHGTNVDFADVKTIMSYQGQALMGIGHAKGEDSAKEAVLNALTHPLMDDITIDSANGLLAYFQFNENYPSYALQEAFMMIHDMLEEDASDPMFGHVFDNTLDEDEVKVTIVATGIGGDGVARDAAPSAMVEPAPTAPTASHSPATSANQKVSIKVAQPNVRRAQPKAQAPQPAQEVAPQPQAKPQNINYRTPVPKQPDEDEEDYPAYWRRNSEV
jgi:cell division protein FtsZ